MNSSDELFKATLKWLDQRGIDLDDIARLTFELQSPYIKDLKLEDAWESVEAVLCKREVQNAVLTGIFLDTAAEKELASEPLLTQLKEDDPLFGIDEVLALSIVNIYGSIGLTNFGYLDKEKPGVIEKLNKKKGKEKVNTFLDDLVAAIAAAAASRLAHKARDNGDK